MTEHVTRVLRKGIVVIPKALREEVGIKEGDLVVIRSLDGKIVVEPLESKVVVVDVGPEVVEKILREVDEEEKKLSRKKLRGMLGGGP